MQFPQSLAITEDTFRAGDAWLVDFVNQYAVPALVAMKAAWEANKPSTPPPADGWLPRALISVPATALDDPAHRVRFKPAVQPGVTLAARILLTAAQELGVAKPAWGFSKHGDFADFVERQWTMGDFQRGEPQDYRGIHNSMSALMTMMKQEGKKRLFLPGRDTWPWAVMAAARGVPFTYVPGISRGVADDLMFGAFLRHNFGIEYLQESLGFDTGFAGSIFNKMERVLGSRLTWVLFSADRYLTRPVGSFVVQCGTPRASKDTVQVFPTMKGARHAALYIEDRPKILKSGSSVANDLTVIQYVDSPYSILWASIDTCRLFYGGAKIDCTKERVEETGTMLWRLPKRGKLRSIEYKETFCVQRGQGG